MKPSSFSYLRPWLLTLAGFGLLCYMTSPSLTQQPPAASQPKPEVGKTSYDQISPVLIGQETFASMMAKDKAGKAGVMARQKALLEERYDLTKKVDAKVTMTRGKPIPVGPTAKLPAGTTWEQLAKLSPDEIRDKGVFPKGYLPLPHPNHPVGGMVFPQHQIKQFARLERFDLDFDLPEHFLPEFPPAMFLTTRPDLGDVSQGKVVTLENFQDIFQGILNAKDLEGMRLLVTQFPQQQFNATHDRKTVVASMGVACFDCHVNGHTSGATHLVGDIRPQSHRRRIDTVSLRGVNVQRIFGSQRAMKSDRGLHPIRATGGLLRRRPADGHRQGHQLPGPLDARSTSWPSFRTCSISRRRRILGSTASWTRKSSRPTRRRCAARSCSSARPSAPCAIPLRTTPTTRCTT